MRPSTNGDETDAFGRRPASYNWRPGVRKAIKSRASRRDRRVTREVLRTGREA